MRLKWTFEACFEDAKKYSSKREWRAANQSAYVSASNKGWITACCKHMVETKKPNGYWNFERCLEDALKYKSKNDWAIQSSAACDSAKNKGFYSECTKHMTSTRLPKGTWTFEACFEDAKKYSTKVEWETKSISSYTAALKNKWVDDCSGHMVDAIGLKTDNNVVYMWRSDLQFNGLFVVKLGITSERLGDRRIKQVARASGLKADVIILQKVRIKATEIETVLKKIGIDPKLEKFDGSTEFRAMTAAEIDLAAEIIKQAA